MVVEGGAINPGFFGQFVDRNPVNWARRRELEYGVSERLSRSLPAGVLRDEVDFARKVHSFMLTRSGLLGCTLVESCFRL